jgi:hypothetical protein
MQSELTPLIQKHDPDGEGSPSSWAGTLAGCAAFLLYGGFSILLFSRPLRPVYPWFNGLDMVIFWVPVLFSFGMVVLAWIKSFPRWSHPYVGMSLLFTVVLCFSSPAGCLPLLFTVAIALLITRSTKPLFHLVNQGLQDWTLFAFGAFGTLPIWMEAFCDEGERSFSIPWFIVLTLFMTVVALAYLRSSHFRGRSLVIRAGIFLAGIAFILGPTPFRYKNYLAEAGPLMFFVVAILFLVLLFPVLLVKLIQYWTRPQAGSSP